MKQSLDKAFCEYVVTQGIISNQNVHDVNEKYPDLCMREALLLEEKINLEYYIATLSTLKKQNFEKCETSKIWDDYFYRTSQENKALTEKELQIFKNKLNVDSMSAREHLLIMGIISLEDYKKVMLAILQQQHTKNEQDFDTSTLEFIEKKLDSIESSLQKPKADKASEDASAKTLDAVNSPVATKNVMPDYWEDASAKTLDIVESPLVKIEGTIINVDDVDDASAQTLDIHSPIESESFQEFSEDTSAKTLDVVESPIAKKSTMQDYWEDTSAKTLDIVESPLVKTEGITIDVDDASAQTLDTHSPIESESFRYFSEDTTAKTHDIVESPIAKKSTMQDYWEDTSAKTLDVVASPITKENAENPLNNASFLEDASAMTLDAVESPLKKEKNLDTAKTIASNITFSEYLNVINATEENVSTPNDSYDVSNETLLEVDLKKQFLGEDGTDTLIDQNLCEESRIETLQENNRDTKKLSSDTNKLEYFSTQELDNKHSNDFDSRQMHEAFPSAIVDRIGGLDEKTTHLTNLIREMKDSQVMQIPEIKTKKSYATFIAFILFLMISVAAISFLGKKYFLFEEEMMTLAKDNQNLKTLLENNSKKTMMTPEWFYFDLGNYNKVISLLKNKTDITVHDEYLLARSYLEVSDSDKALAILTEITGLDPNNAEYMYFLAKAQYLRGQLANALKTYDLAEELKYPTQLVLLDKAKIYVDLGSWEKAEKLISLIDKDILFPELKGDIFAHKNQIDEAIDLYSEAINTSKSLYSIKSLLLKRMKLYYEIGNYEHCLEDAQKIVIIDINESEAHYYAGLIYTKLKNGSLSYKSLTQALKISPENALYFQARSELMYLMGKLNPALVDIQKAIKLRPDKGVFHIHEAFIYQKQKDKIKADESIKKGISLSEDNHEFQLLYAKYLLFNKKEEDAIRKAEQSLKLQKSWEAYEFLGDIHSQRGKQYLAIDNWKKSLELNPYLRRVTEKINKEK